ncbi:MAG: hypothetical protein K2O15_11605 [Lachnospiraceae bacterium]|nr:hypothetical protein [Lachnospiraceae bacterium]
MADDKEFDINKIKNAEFMDAKDRQYFEKYGSAMEEQAEIMKENLDKDMIYAEEVYDSVLRRSAGNTMQYLVQGACLKCSKQLETESVQKLVYGDSEINSKADNVKDNSMLQILATRTESANGLPFANVTDTKGGLSGELLKGGTKDGEEKQLNIISFGNCGFLDEEEITDVDKIAERVLQILHSNSDLGDKCRHNGITKDKIIKGILEGIESGKGTCYGCMVLNTEWENLPEEYDYVDNTFDALPEAVGIGGFLEGKQYFHFGGKEAINMMSMLFCRFGGGIINAADSGQSRRVEDVAEDTNVRKLRNKFIGELEFEYWSDQQKRYAELIWSRLYVEKNLNPAFVAAIIGNMCNEGAVGELENWEGWKEVFADYHRDYVITNIEQAEKACSGKIKKGVGMLQWTYYTRKPILLECYKSCASADGTLSEEQLFEAEMNMIYRELHIDGETEYRDFADIYKNCIDYTKQEKNYSQQIEYMTVYFFDSYERPKYYELEIDAENHSVIDEMWDESMNAEKPDYIKNICRRVVAANVAYEHFMKGNK